MVVLKIGIKCGEFQRIRSLNMDSLPKSFDLFMHDLMYNFYAKPWEVMKLAKLDKKEIESIDISVSYFTLTIDVLDINLGRKFYMESEHSSQILPLYSKFVNILI